MKIGSVLFVETLFFTKVTLEVAFFLQISTLTAWRIIELEDCLTVAMKSR